MRAPASCVAGSSCCTATPLAPRRSEVCHQDSGTNREPTLFLVLRCTQYVCPCCCSSEDLFLYVLCVAFVSLLLVSPLRTNAVLTQRIWRGKATRAIVSLMKAQKTLKVQRIQRMYRCESLCVYNAVQVGASCCVPVHANGTSQTECAVGTSFSRASLALVCILYTAGATM